MKLKNKLLPLTGIALTAAAVVPFVTSCKSANQGSWEWNVEDGFHLSTTPMEGKEYEGTEIEVRNEITKQWVSDVNENYNVFYDDFINTIFGGFDASNDWISKNCFIPTHMFMQINNVNLYTLKNGGDKLNYFLLSADVQLKGMVFWINQSTPAYPPFVSQETTVDINFVNIPFVFQMVNHVAGFVIPPMDNIWVEAEWSARVIIEQSKNITERVLNVDDDSSVPLKFPILAPANDDNIMPIKYLKSAFDMPVSYHFCLCSLNIA